MSSYLSLVSCTEILAAEYNGAASVCSRFKSVSTDGRLPTFRSVGMSTRL